MEQGTLLLMFNSSPFFYWILKSNRVLNSLECDIWFWIFEAITKLKKNIDLQCLVIFQTIAVAVKIGGYCRNSAVHSSYGRCKNVMCMRNQIFTPSKAALGSHFRQQWLSSPSLLLFGNFGLNVAMKIRII